MVYYCEKCKTLSHESVCDYCGRKKLSPVKDDDICFVTELSNFYATMFEEALKSIDVPVFSLPSGFSLINRANSHRKIYVPYNCTNKASDTYRILFGNSEETE